MNVTNCTLSGNTGSLGPGINNNSFGTVNVSNSTISGNMGGDEGGGIANLGTGTVTVTDSLVDNNSVGSFRLGGNIVNFGILNLIRSTVSRGLAGSGGGIYNRDGTVNVTNSTISGNMASDPDNAGGGILNSGGGTVNVTNSTVSISGIPPAMPKGRKKVTTKLRGT